MDDQNKWDETASPGFFDPEVFRKEKEKARRLRASAWWAKLRARGICGYCGKKVHPNNLTMDHIVPLIRGGKSEHSNIVACCKECNQTKSHMSPAEWKKHLETVLQNREDHEKGDGHS